MTPEQELAMAMMPAQDPRMQQAPQPPPNLLSRLLALLQGQQQPQQATPQYLPPEMMPPDAQELQRRKAEILHQAMGVE